MSNIFTKSTWSPYLAGVLVGILGVLSVLVTTFAIDKGQYIGASTTYVRAAGFIEKLFSPGHVENNTYFQEEKVKVDWQMMFVLGIFFGALISSLTGKTFKSEKVPPMWEKHFGSKISTRAIGAFIGGGVAMFGARLAGGCPSGHGLSGLMQLSVSGFLALICFMIGGIITAKILYKGGK
ncbi:MAG: YeeE/YedE family protein [Desulfobacterales bacterium]|nr:YeeE/YedE family protein [Desulfobacterales bacterium]